MADIRLTKPEANTQQNIPGEAGAKYVFDFPEQPVFSKDGDNLSLTFEDGSKVNVQDFYKIHNSEDMPSFEVQGEEISAEDFFTAMNEPDLAPAAGAERGGDAAANARFHQFANMNLLEGIDHLWQLDWNMNRAFEPEELYNSVGRDHDHDWDGEPEEPANAVPSISNPPSRDPEPGPEPGDNDEPGGTPFIPASGHSHVVVDEGLLYSEQKGVELDGGSGRHTYHGITGQASFTVHIPAEEGGRVELTGVDGENNPVAMVFVVAQDGTVTPAEDNAEVFVSNGVDLSNFQFSASGNGDFTVTYDYLLQGHQDHDHSVANKNQNYDADFNNDDVIFDANVVHIKVIDGSGDEAFGQINVEVHDDVPFISVDGNASYAEESATVTGQVVNWGYGADNAADKSFSLVLTRYAEGADIQTNPSLATNVELNGTLQEDGSYIFSNGLHTVTLNPDGKFTYVGATSISRTSTVFDFNFTVIDSDGDVAQDTASVTVKYNPTFVTLDGEAVIWENGVYGHLAPRDDAGNYKWGSGASNVTLRGDSGSEDLVSGTIGGDFRIISGGISNGVYDADNESNYRFSVGEGNTVNVSAAWSPGGEAPLYVTKTAGGVSLTDNPGSDPVYATLNFTPRGDGTYAWTFEPNNAAGTPVNSLTEGEVIEIRLVVEATGEGQTGTGVLDLIINGANDMPTVAVTPDTGHNNFALYGGSAVYIKPDNFVAAGGEGWDKKVYSNDEEAMYRAPGSSTPRVLDGWIDEDGNARHDVGTNAENHFFHGRPVVHGCIKVDDPDADAPIRASDAAASISASAPDVTLFNGNFLLTLACTNHGSQIKGEDGVFVDAPKVKWHSVSEFEALRDLDALKDQPGVDFVTIKSFTEDGKTVTRIDAGNGYEDIAIYGADRQVYSEFADGKIDGILNIADGDYIRVDGEYGSLFINASGDYYYVLGNNEAQQQAVLKLAADVQLYDKFGVGVLDAHDSGKSTGMEFKVFGSNDAPVIDVENTTANIEAQFGIASSDYTGQVKATDVDESLGGVSETQSLQYFLVSGDGSLVTQMDTGHGLVSIDPATGQYTFTLNQSLDSVRSLKTYGGDQGNGIGIDHLVDVVNVAAVDIHGAAATQEVEILIKGQNTAPTVDKVDVGNGFVQIIPNHLVNNGQNIVTLDGSIKITDINTQYKGDGDAYRDAIHSTANEDNELTFKFILNDKAMEQKLEDAKSGEIGGNTKVTLGGRDLTVKDHLDAEENIVWKDIHTNQAQIIGKEVTGQDGAVTIVRTLVIGGKQEIDISSFDHYIETANGVFLYNSQTGEYKYQVTDNDALRDELERGSQLKVSVTVTDDAGATAATDFIIYQHGYVPGPRYTVYLDPPTVRVQAEGDETGNTVAMKGTVIPAEKVQLNYIELIGRTLQKDDNGEAQTVEKVIKVDGEKLFYVDARGNIYESLDSASDAGAEVVGMITFSKDGKYEFSTVDSDGHDFAGLVHYGTGVELPIIKLGIDANITELWDGGQKELTAHKELNIVVTGANDDPEWIQPASGVFTYDPENGWTQTAAIGYDDKSGFTIRIADPFDSSHFDNVDQNTFKGQIAATDADDGETAQLVYQLIENGEAKTSVEVHALDAAGNPTGPVIGTLLLNADGSYAFTSTGAAYVKGTNGSVTVRVTDPNGGFSDTQFNIVLDGKDDKPFFLMGEALGDDQFLLEQTVQIVNNTAGNGGYEGTLAGRVAADRVDNGFIWGDEKDPSSPGHTVDNLSYQVFGVLNDKNEKSWSFAGSVAGKYGTLVFNNDGSYVYNLNAGIDPNTITGTEEFQIRIREFSGKSGIQDQKGKFTTLTLRFDFKDTSNSAPHIVMDSSALSGDILITDADEKDQDYLRLRPVDIAARLLGKNGAPDKVALITSQNNSTTRFGVYEQLLDGSVGARLGYLTLIPVAQAQYTYEFMPDGDAAANYKSLQFNITATDGLADVSDTVTINLDNIEFGTDSADNKTFTDAQDHIYNGLDGDDAIIGGDGNDMLYGDLGNDVVSGGKGSDILYGGEGKDALHGGEGADRLYGDGGNDLLFGGSGNDELHGGAGDDYLDGGEGSDTIYAGEGNDIIVYDQSDYLIDGGSGIDFLIASDENPSSLSDMLANWSKAQNGEYNEGLPMVHDVEVMLKGVDTTSLTDMNALAEKYGITIGKDANGKETLSLDASQWVKGDQSNDGQTTTWNHIDDGKTDQVSLETTMLETSPSDQVAQDVVVLTMQAESGA